MRAVATVPTRPARAAASPASGVPAWIFQFAFIAAHVPLALAIPKHSKLAVVHALIVFGIGLIAAVMPRKMHLAAYAAAYIAGAGVFWRMKAASIPWEFDKYAIVAIFLVAFVFSVRVRRPGLPLTYLALLVPSAFMTVSSTSWDDAKAALSFNMSGPITLTIAMIFFSSIRISPVQMRWLMTVILAPVLGIAALAASSFQLALKDPEFEFGSGSSNPATSGGFGPNQVSSMLGLGLVAIAIYLIVGRSKRVVTGTMLLLSLFLARQCLLTLSRGGVYMALGSVGAASFFLLQDRAYRGKLLAAIAVVGVVLIFVVIPRLEAITGGVLVSRLENTSGTGRELLIKADFESWAENPILGVGPGMGGKNRLKYFHVPTAHTEYTRMVGEHGLLGLASLVLLGAMAVRSVREQKTRQGKAISVAFLTYALFFMTVNAMRFAAPCFVFGLSSVTMVVTRRRARAVARPRRLAPVEAPAAL